MSSDHQVPRFPPYPHTIINPEERYFDMCSTKDLNIILGPFSDPARAASVQLDADRRGVNVGTCYMDYIKDVVSTLANPGENSESGFDGLFSIILGINVHVSEPPVEMSVLDGIIRPTLIFSTDSVFDLEGKSLKREFSEALSDESKPKELASFICELLQLEWTRVLVVETP
jgi:hypothetical protein